MMCRKPFVRGMEAFGCGQCMPCRFNRRRIWTHRIMLESLVHRCASFVTLTYNDENLPAGGTLVPRDLQLFLKRLRRQMPVKLRFFGVGEYGDFSWRPHYHLALFGCDRSCGSLLRKAWPSGFVHVGDLTYDSAQYVCGYVTKKLTRSDDDRLHGRYPEFARMSLRPGIGALAIEEVAAALQNRAGWDYIGDVGDVPSVLRHGRKSMPLGRYMRTRLRAAMNFAEVGESAEAAYKRSAEMLVMYKDYLLNEKEEALGVGDFVRKTGAAKAVQLENRLKILNSRKGLGL